MAEPTVAVCTIVARSYLPSARVLAASYVGFHPTHRFVIGVIDEMGTPSGDGGAYELRGPSSFGIPTDDYLRMATAYSGAELATAVKPYLLRELRAEADLVIYLDPDIRVLAPMPELVDAASNHGIVLTPHFLTPLPRDGMEPDERDIMATGVFNLGFVAVGPGSEPFLDFWAQRLRQDAIIAPEQQLFTDQRWVDQVPALFGHHVLRDPGFNVAYWNIHERPVALSGDGTPTAAGQPLRFFRFSGYRPEKPWQLSDHCARNPRVRLSEHPAVRVLCDSYGEALCEAGYAQTLADVPYGFSHLQDGTAMTRHMRRLYRDAWVAADQSGESPPPPGFAPGGDAELRVWLSSGANPTQAALGVGRLAASVWDRRTDVQRAFPDPFGADADGYRRWCATSGVAEEELPRWAAPTEIGPIAEADSEFGVNMLGYFTAQLGVGEMGRIVHEAAQRAGVPITTVVEDHWISNRTGLDAPITLGDPRYGVSLLCVNADQTSVVLAGHPTVGYRRFRIGFWAWELEDFPVHMHSAFALVDEIWTISEFCRAAIARHSPVPVKAFPVPVRDPGPPVRRQRTDGDPVQFLFVFDFNSVAQRKNPWGAVEAFRTAFPGDEPVRLVIKAINGEQHASHAERLRVMCAADRRIELLERYLRLDEIEALYVSTDCYVSLHRSEGFGLTVAEAMARALPVIATDYSGSAEFLSPLTGWPVPYSKIPVGDEASPYQADAMWADPDLEAAAKAMREVAENPELAARRGQAARADILAARSMDAAAHWLRTELEAAHRKWRRGEFRAADPGVATAPFGPLREFRRKLAQRPDFHSASRLPMAAALRRAVWRALDHYEGRQRSLFASLADAVEPVLTDSGDLVTGLERRTFEMFQSRDVRTDESERAFRELKVQVEAMQAAVATLHAPVPAGAQVVVCDAGVLLVPQDRVFLPALLARRSWEEPEARLLASVAGSGLFVDVGAHVGYHTLRLLTAAPGITGAVAVEANPANAELLRRNVAANLPGKVAILPVAAWNEPTTVRLAQIDADNSGSFRAYPDAEDGSTVEALRLDECPELRDRVALVKVDVQGRDHRALDGLASVLERDRPHVVCGYCPAAIEELGDSPAEVLAGYRAFGYDVLVLAGDDSDDRWLTSDDAQLVEFARRAPDGFATLWLRSPGSES